jgi:tetratricopeptide (TPR) repeat protein
MRTIGLCQIALITELVCCSLVAAQQLPMCPTPERQNTSPSVVRASAGLVLTRDDSFTSRLFPSPQIVLEVEYNESGQMVCAGPLSGLDLYWPYAIDAVSRLPPKKAGRHIIIFEDPGRVGNRTRSSFDEKDALRCADSDSTDTLLEIGNYLLDRNRDKEAMQCFTQAVKLAPNSLAANYGAAVCSSRLKQSSNEIQYLERTLALRPSLFGARIAIGQEYNRIGKLDRAVQTLKAVLDDNPPLPTQQRLYGVLISMYDDADLRKEALGAARSFLGVLEELRNRYPPLVKALELAFGGGDLALRFEEQGKHNEAEENYRKAAGYSKDKLVSEAFLFEMELGRARSLRRRGENTAATTVCDYWRRRIRSLGRQLENWHWGGRVLTQAQWECSCGEFTKGLEMIRAEAKRRPESDTPYRLLSNVYRARGESNLAKLAFETAEKIRIAHDRRILNAILEEAEQLYRLGGAKKIK